MVKLPTSPFQSHLVEEAFVKHGITQVTAAAQITEEKWKQARVPLQRALWLRRASSEVSEAPHNGECRSINILGSVSSSPKTPKPRI